MPVYYPNNKLTKKQRAVLKALDDFENKLDEEFNKATYNFNISVVRKIVKQLRVENGLEERYPTIREYLESRSFTDITCKFKLQGMKIKVCNIYEFVDRYNKNLLDEYVVKKARRTFWSVFVGEDEVLKLTLERKRK